MAELAADVALERARLDAARTGDRKLAEAIVTVLASGDGHGAAPAEIASLMRAAGLPPDGRYLVAAMAAAASAMVTGPNADRWRRDLAGELAMPIAEGALVAPLGDEIVVLVPSPGDPAPADAGAAPDDSAAQMYVHVNMVRYRIRRIEELTGRDLSCLDDQVDFFLALRIR